MSPKRATPKAREEQRRASILATRLEEVGERMSQSLFETSESEQAESQRKTFKGIGCAAGALAFPAPFLFGFPGGFAMVPVLVIIGFVFMFLAISAKRRRDRALLAEAPAIFPPPIAAPVAPANFASAHVDAPGHAASTLNADAKLNERLNKAKKAGF